jgi:hypothetical protein
MELFSGVIQKFKSATAPKEMCFWALMTLLVFLLSHSSTYADWPLTGFAGVLVACQLRLVWLAQNSDREI